MENKRKIIGLDARFYGPLGKGLGRYTKEVVDRVIQDTENDYVVFLSVDNFSDFDIANFSNVKKVLVKARWYSCREQIELPYLIWRHKINLMHFLHFNVPVLTPTKFIVTIHDLILTKFPTLRATKLSPILYWLKNFIYRFVIWLAVRRSQVVIAVSQFTKEDIENQFKVSSDKVKMIYEGVADSLNSLEEKHSKNDDKKIILGYNIHKPYLLYVGNAYPHKNLEGLIRIFSNLTSKKPDLSLVLVGKSDYFYSRVQAYAKKFKHKGEIIFPGYVPDEDLAAFFRQAESYVFASLYEGFGLPPLEAMAQECPVISSDKACMPEVLGEAASYFNPEDEELAGEKILNLINNQEAKKELVHKGKEQVEKYSWDKCAKKILRLYNTFK
jgi:glycosyltransferase involved in cell wall biosynthesis